MSFSLTEVQAMARKAARGVGYSWGMADEAGLATRMLCGWGLDGCAALVRVLDLAERRGGPAPMAPLDLAGVWRSGTGQLCPLATGATLSDSAHLWQDRGVEAASVAVPVLLLPFVALAAAALGRPLTLAAGTLGAVTDGQALSLTPAGSDPPLHAAQVTVTPGGRLSSVQPPASRATPRPTDWQILNRWAERTLAPATESSRLKGAGAGLSDND